MTVAMALIASGCASVSQIQRGDSHISKMDSASSVYILLPKDAMYYSKVCSRSGRAIAQLISSAFMKYSTRVEISAKEEELSEGLNKAKEGNFAYLVNAKINRWEDRATEWNGMWDEIQMEMNVFDVQSGNLLDSQVLEGHGTWVTFGGYHPQNIVRHPINNYVASLFK